VPFADKARVITGLAEDVGNTIGVLFGAGIDEVDHQPAVGGIFRGSVRIADRCDAAFGSEREMDESLTGQAIFPSLNTRFHIIKLALF
jgi:hypothetical protein